MAGNDGQGGQRSRLKSGLAFRHYPYVEASWPAPYFALGAGTGFFLWYTKTVGFPIVPIGVYRNPPPIDAGPGVKSVELADIGVIPALERATALSNWLLKKAQKLGL